MDEFELSREAMRRAREDYTRRLYSDRVAGRGKQVIQGRVSGRAGDGSGELLIRSQGRTIRTRHLSDGGLAVGDEVPITTSRVGALFSNSFLGPNPGGV